MTKPKKSHELRASIIHAVAPDHPLPHDVILQMLDDTHRWAICQGPFFEGREQQPIGVTFFPHLHALTESIMDDREAS